MKNKKLIQRLKSITKGHHWEVDSWYQIFDNKIFWHHYKKYFMYDK